MVGMMTAVSKGNLAGIINSAKFAVNTPSKLDHLRRLRDELSLAGDSALLQEFLPLVVDLHSDRSSPARKFVIEMIGAIGLKHTELLPEIIPALIAILKDDTPAVARQAIRCGIDIFRHSLVKVAIQGLYSSELESSLKSSWEWVLKLKDEIYSIAFKPGSDGRRLLALKFVETIILLCTPDPGGSSEPPADQTPDEILEDFNISWLRGGHPVLNVGDLSVEASQSLGMLLDQLRFPTVKSLSNMMVIVLIKSLSAIAKQRPAFYGRILPVLLGLDPSSSVSMGAYISGVHHGLKNAFLSCLKCTHPGAAPWRDRLVGALREMKAGELAEEALHQFYQVNGSVDWKDDSSMAQEEKPSVKTCDADNSPGRKRSGIQDNNLVEDDHVSVKRARPSPNLSEGSAHELSCRDQDDVSSSGRKTAKGNEDNGPVQQLVAMFGALVAQGEKAVGSLEILISSISADLLAEVVMANMRHLPPNRPKAEGDEELLLDKGSHPSMAGGDTRFRHLSSLLTDILLMPSTSAETDAMLDAQQSPASDIEKPEEVGKHATVTPSNNDAAYGDLNSAIVRPVEPTVLPVSSVTDGYLAIPSEIADIGDLDNEIPGLDSSTRSDGLEETLAVSSLVSTGVEDTSQEQVTSLDRSSTEIIPSMSTDRSEELSPKAISADATSTNALTENSGLSFQMVLPKMSAPVISLTDDQKDDLQKTAFMHIIEAYKQIAVAGGSQVRFSLLAYLGVEFPLELDPWKLLQKHILSDYMNHEACYVASLGIVKSLKDNCNIGNGVVTPFGPAVSRAIEQGHDLTLRVLYRLFAEAEADRDFFSSTTATSVYEMFLLAVAETLRDSFPASDKSLSRLLGEVPYLPKSVLKLLECLCCPGNSDKDEKEMQNGDRVTQGLSAVWSLILLRPPTRDVCLGIALQSAVYHLEEVRMKAIRLVANKLYPLSSISQQIEDFAKKMLLSVPMVDQNVEGRDANGSNSELEKDPNLGKPPNERPSVSAITKDISSDTGQSCISESTSLSSVTERSMLTYSNLMVCTDAQKHSLFREVLLIYNGMSKTAKQAVHWQIPILVRTIGSSSQLLEIISDPPTGSGDLLMQVLQTLTDGTIPSPELIFTIRKLYDTKVKDAEILIPVLPFLQKDEALQIFPHFVNLPLDKFQAALARAVQGSSQSGPVLTPAEVLIAIHGIDPDRDGIFLKKITDACNACFEQRQIFTQQVLAKVLNQLVEHIPLPLLFMRTVLQAIGAFPSLVDFIMEILSRLVNKQIWKHPKLWVGFLKCALLTKPQSFGVLLQLPPAQLENALHRTPALKAPLIAHANQPNIRPLLPRSVLVVLGIASDSQSASQMQSQSASLAQTTHDQTGDAVNSEKEITEKSKESSGAS
ncbi:hypothetical protein RJ639_003621 [Escallonia herrerae]|uniref:Symplekin n=1 Tax=Escallonia herrerae TaxID=1293975 RepID=A0AA88W431_9ASTE|nr:hypothetical protein RJ639_003621 [Escallonia herrerae]